jgi:hypothetical protein
MDDLKRTVVAAGSLSFILVINLLVFVDSQVRQPRAGAALLGAYVLVLMLTYATVHLWVQSAKKYIDRAIDRKLATNGGERQPS